MATSLHIQYENAMMQLHEAPAPFNPNYRPGLGKAVSKAYAEYCEANPDVSQDDRKAAYARIHDELVLTHPTFSQG